MKQVRITKDAKAMGTGKVAVSRELETEVFERLLERKLIYTPISLRSLIALAEQHELLDPFEQIVLRAQLTIDEGLNQEKSGFSGGEQIAQAGYFSS